MLSQPVELIYSIGPLIFKTAFSVKIDEETISLNDHYETFQLLSRVLINKYVQKGFHYKK